MIQSLLNAFITSSALLAIPVSSANQASDLVKCVKHSDCVLIHDTCGELKAINKTHFSAHAKVVTRAESLTFCANLSEARFYEGMRAHCEAGSCISIAPDKKTKSGPSDELKEFTKTYGSEWYWALYSAYISRTAPWEMQLTPNKLYSDFLTHHLAKDWASFEKLSELMRDDPSFGSFVIGHITFLNLKSDLMKIQNRARTRCPKGKERVCEAILQNIVNGDGSGMGFSIRRPIVIDEKTK